MNKENLTLYKNSVNYFRLEDSQGLTDKEKKKNICIKIFSIPEVNLDSFFRTPSKSYFLRAIIELTPTIDSETTKTYVSIHDTVDFPS